MLNYKQIWHGIKPIRWLNKFNLTALKTVKLVERETTWTTKIGTTWSPEMRTRLIQFLKENLDIFAWSHEDMPGISTKVIQHRLNVDLEKKPVQQ